MAADEGMMSRREGEGGEGEKRSRRRKGRWSRGEGMRMSRVE